MKSPGRKPTKGTRRHIIFSEEADKVLVKLHKDTGMDFSLIVSRMVLGKPVVFVEKRS